MIREILLRRFDESRLVDRIFDWLDDQMFHRGARQAKRVREARAARRSTQ